MSTDTIPCLSLWQPWATLMAIGAKRNETRSWETLYRGPLAIHAAKTWNGKLESMCYTEPFHSVLMKQRPNEGGAFFDDDALMRILPFGRIVAVVNLYSCVRIGEHNAPPEGTFERAFGDYTPGRFAWWTDNEQLLADPVPFVGRQGLFNVPRSLVGL